jgi:hypothetical protein
MPFAAPRPRFADFACRGRRAGGRFDANRNREARVKTSFVTAALLFLPAIGGAQTLPGSRDVDGSRLSAGKWEVSLTVHREGQAIPMGTQRSELVEVGGASPRWMLITTTSTERGVATDTSVAERAGLRPVRHRGHAAARNLFLDFDGRKVTGSYTPAEGAARSIERTTEVPTFDSAMLELIIGALPLKAAYATRIPTYIEEQEGLAWFDVVVTGERTVDGIEGWVVRASGPAPPVELVIAKDTRRMLAGSTEFPNGMRMEMKRS